MMKCVVVVLVLVAAVSQQALAASNMTDASGCVWEWQYTPCSKPCNGGTFTRYKQVLERPENVACVAITNQTDILCNEAPCSSDTGADSEPEMRAEHGDIVFSVQDSKDIVFEHGERRVSLFSDLEAQIHALATSLDTQITSLATTFNALSSTTAANIDEETKRINSTIAATQSTAASQITDALSEVSRVSSAAAEQRVDISNAQSSNAGVTSLLSSAMDTLTATSLPALSSAITENTREHESVSSLVAQVSMSESQLSTYIDGQPEFTTMSFGRDCDSNYYFVDAFGTRWKIPVNVDERTVLYDADTNTGFTFQPSTGGNGARWWMSLEGASGIACQVFGRENDRIKPWHLREATDGGNGVHGIWGGDKRVPTFMLSMQYAHCSPADKSDGLCEHPKHLPNCYSMRLLCFP